MQARKHAKHANTQARQAHHLADSNQHLLREVLTVKDDENQHFNYSQPKVAQQIFHNTVITGLIHKALTKAAITKLFGLCQSHLAK